MPAHCKAEWPATFNIEEKTPPELLVGEGDYNETGKLI